jgi:hypothetical protein
MRISTAIAHACTQFIVLRAFFSFVECFEAHAITLQSVDLYRLVL